jgi:hypothetical protein
MIQRIFQATRVRTRGLNTIGIGSRPEKTGPRGGGASFTLHALHLTTELMSAGSRFSTGSRLKFSLKTPVSLLVNFRLGN